MLRGFTTRIVVAPKANMTDIIPLIELTPRAPSIDIIITVDRM
jgi:hypothetical protein